MRANSCHEKARGDVYTLLANSGGWDVKKGLALLFSRIPGHHVMLSQVQAKPANIVVGPAEQAPARTAKASPSWRPTREEVRLGMAFIKTVPPDTDDLEQQEWILANRTNPSPIMGWPDGVVSKAVARINAGRSDADVEYFYPLLACDLKDVFKEEIIPLMLPHAKEYGLMCAGWPGVGKTPFGKIWGMLLGRYWIAEKGVVNRRACFRRGKKMERFKTKAQELWELLMLDDPNMGLYDFEEWKAWFELSEAGSGDGRYNDATCCKNGPRALFTNALAFDKEPGENEPMTPAHFGRWCKTLSAPSPRRTSSRCLSGAPASSAGSAEFTFVCPAKSLTRPL